MKVFKELPKSIYYTIFLRFKSSKQLIRGKKNIPVLISFTSIPSRLNTLDIAVKSILNQTTIPEKIYLWLHNDLRNKIPRRLESLKSEIFEIKFSDLDCSHMKLIHTLRDNPNKNIVTCDDDFIYRHTWLEKLYEEHLKFPKDIIANVTTQIKMDENGNYLPTSKWNYSDDISQNRLLALGAGGVFYPPNSLNNKVFDVDLFLKLTPKADDLWFKAMSLLNGTLVRRVTDLPEKPLPIAGSQKISLKQHNVKNKGNDFQWEELSSFFNLKKLLKDEKI